MTAIKKPSKNTSKPRYKCVTCYEKTQKLIQNIIVFFNPLVKKTFLYVFLKKPNAL